MFVTCEAETLENKLKAESLDKLDVLGLNYPQQPAVKNDYATVHYETLV